MRIRIPVFALLLMCVAFAIPAQVQAQAVVTDPNTVEFAASPDHSVIRLDGTPLVVKYLLRFYLEGATTPVQEQDLGKPTPVDGRISVTNRTLFTVAPLALDTRYLARVAAAGPTGVTESDPSNPFGNASPQRPPGAPGVPTLRRQ